MSFLTSAVRRTSLRLSLSLRAAFNLCYMCMKWVSKESLLLIIYYPMDGFAKYRGRERLKMWMRLDTRERLLTFFFWIFFEIENWVAVHRNEKQRILAEGFHVLCQKDEDSKVWDTTWHKDVKMLLKFTRKATNYRGPYFHQASSSLPSRTYIVFSFLFRIHLSQIERSRSRTYRKDSIVRTWSSPPLFTK